MGTKKTQKPGRSPGGKTGAEVEEAKIWRPIAGEVYIGRGWHESSKGVIGKTGTSGSIHWHSGLDVGVAGGTPCVAPTNGKITMATLDWSDGGMVHFQFTQDTGDIKAGTVIGWGHIEALFVKVGDTVEGGQVIAHSGVPGGGAHVHFVQRYDSADGDGSVDPKPLFLALDKGETTPTKGGNVSGGGGGGGSSSDSTGAKAAAFATFISMPGIFDSAESMALRGQKSLMNDQPLLPFIEQLSAASLRNFMSMPNGNFYAFYPDYFGGLGRTAYWQIEDIEIINGQIQLSDDALATHVYVVGDTVGMDGVNVFDKIQSGGVVTVFNAFMADFLNGIPADLAEEKKDKKTNKNESKSNKQQKFDSTKPSLNNKDEAIKFLQKHGARPKFEEAPMVRSPIFESFLAYQRFCLMWAQQFRTTFEFTFMPELFPGGIVAFPEHGLQCYVEEVTHNGSYTEGFTTTATLSAPSALRDNGGKPINPDRAWVHSGMIRAFAFDEDEVGQANVKAPKKEKKDKAEPKVKNN